MPYVIRPPVRRMSLLGSLIAAAICTLLVVVPSRAAAATCDPVPVSNPFARFLDFADYALVPGGDFEPGAPGWSFQDAQVSNGVASIDPRGEAVSPAFCISADHPTFRFMTRGSAGGSNALRVFLRWNEGNVVREAFVYELDGSYSSWLPSPILPLALRLNLIQSDLSREVQLVFRVKPLSSSWAIDDVYYDPYRR